MMNWDFVQKASLVCGFIVIAIGVIWYFVALEGRIVRLEAQLQALAIAPAILQKDNGKSQNEVFIVPNPLMQACADLSLKAAQAYERGTSLTVGQPIIELMQRMGCDLRKQ